MKLLLLFALGCSSGAIHRKPDPHPAHESASTPQPWVVEPSRGGATVRVRTQEGWSDLGSFVGLVDLDGTGPREIVVSEHHGISDIYVVIYQWQVDGWRRIFEDYASDRPYLVAGSARKLAFERFDVSPDPDDLTGGCHVVSMTAETGVDVRVTGMDDPADPSIDNRCGRGWAPLVPKVQSAHVQWTATGEGVAPAIVAADGTVAVPIVDPALAATIDDLVRNTPELAGVDESGRAVAGVRLTVVPQPDGLHVLGWECIGCRDRPLPSPTVPQHRFSGGGTEPFYGVSIADGVADLWLSGTPVRFTFRAPDALVVGQPWRAQPDAANSSMMRFDEPVEIRLDREPCDDGMSSTLHSHQVRVNGGLHGCVEPRW